MVATTTISFGALEHRPLLRSSAIVLSPGCDEYHHDALDGSCSATAGTSRSTSNSSSNAIVFPAQPHALDDPASPSFITTTSATAAAATTTRRRRNPTTTTRRRQRNDRRRTVHFHDDHDIHEIPNRHSFTEEQRRSMFSTRDDQIRIQRDAMQMAKAAAKVGQLNSENAELRGLEVLMPHNKQRRMNRMKIAKREVLQRQTYGGSSSFWPRRHQRSNDSTPKNVILSSLYMEQSRMAANVAQLQAVVDRHETSGLAKATAPMYIQMMR